jgi:anti-sigma B factor antagonist
MAISRDLEIDISRTGSCSVLHARGDINWDNSPLLRASILDLLEKRGQKTVIVDLGEVRRMESSGVSVLIEGLQLAARKNARFMLTRLNDSIRRMLDLTRLTSAFEITESLPEALALGARLAA